MKMKLQELMASKKMVLQINDLGPKFQASNFWSWIYAAFISSRLSFSIDTNGHRSLSVPLLCDLWTWKLSPELTRHQPKH